MDSFAWFPVRQGVSTDEVQLAICQGQPYGGRKHSTAEREAACQRYEQMTGLIAPRANTGEGILMAGSIIAVILLFVLVWYVIHKGKKSKEVQVKRHSNRL